MLNAPELDEGLALYWVAFCELSTCRPPSFGEMAAIPWTSINQYATFYKYEDRQRERLHFIVGKMDKAMRDWHKRRQKSHG